VSNPIDPAKFTGIQASGPGGRVRIVTYCGRPITELSREELIEALERAAEQIEQERELHDMDRQMATVLKGART
jgi:hypothetical protein